MTWPSGGAKGGGGGEGLAFLKSCFCERPFAQGLLNLGVATLNPEAPTSPEALKPTIGAYIIAKNILRGSLL